MENKYIFLLKSLLRLSYISLLMAVLISIIHKILIVIAELSNSSNSNTVFMNLYDIIPSFTIEIIIMSIASIVFGVIAIILGFHSNRNTSDHK